MGSKNKECEVCGLYYQEYWDDESIKEEDEEALTHGNRCAGCLEEYGDILWPDQI